jgi:hypothetical protein
MRARFAAIAVAILALTACQPIIAGIGPSPNYPTFTPNGNPQGSAEHRALQGEAGELEVTDTFDPVYDTFCTWDDVFFTFVCPAYVLEQNPNRVDELNAGLYALFRALGVVS